MTIRWFTDEDRRRMREEERMSRLWNEFFWDYTVRHSRTASRDQQVSPGQMKLLDHGLPLGEPDPPPRQWKHRPRFDL